MSEPTYTFSPNVNTSFASDIRTASAAVTRELGDLHDDLMNSLSAWATQSSRGAYDTHKTNWDNAAKAMPESLNVGADVMDNVTDLMVRTERAMTDPW